MKGQASYPFSMVEAAFTFLIVVGVAYSMQGYIQDYIAEETSDLRADRVQNAAEMLQHYNEGYVQVNLNSQYEYRVSGSSLMLKYGESEHERNLGYMDYNGFNGPTNYNQSSIICLQKQDGELEMEDGC